MLRESLPNGLRGDLQAGDAYKLVDQERLIPYGFSEPEHELHVLERILRSVRRQFGAALQAEFQNRAFDSAEMRQKDGEWLIQFVIDRVADARFGGRRAQLIQHGLIDFQLFQNSQRRLALLLSVAFYLNSSLGLSLGSRVSKGLLPSHEVCQTPLVCSPTSGGVIFLLCQQEYLGPLVCILTAKLGPLVCIAAFRTDEPRLNPGCVRAVLRVRNGRGDVGGEVQLHAPRFGVLAIAFPRAGAAKIFHGVAQRDERDEDDDGVEHLPAEDGAQAVAEEGEA